MFIEVKGIFSLLFIIGQTIFLLLLLGGVLFYLTRPILNFLYSRILKRWTSLLAIFVALWLIFWIFSSLVGRYELNAQCDYFETDWKPKSWTRRHRFIFVRQQAKVQQQTPVQLDLFVPHEYGFSFKVVLTNKRLSAARTVAFHNGRGSQEGIFGELKSQNQMGYVPTRTWCGNQVYMLSALLAHNLTRELQMLTRAPERSTQQKRPALWEFEQLDTLRRRIIQRAGRLIRPQGKLTLSMAANEATENEMLQILEAIERAAWLRLIMLYATLGLTILGSD